MDNSALIIAFFAGTLVVFILGAFAVVFTLIHKRKQLLNKKEKLLLETQFRQELLQTEVEIKEQTLQHISRELHDNLGQVASLIKINLNTLTLDDRKKAEEKIAFTKELTRQLITDLKSLSVSLSSQRISEMGLYNALANELERLQKTGLQQAQLIRPDELPQLDNDCAIILFRMSQEILNNILKHAKAKNIYCILKYVQNQLVLVFSDDGIGFDTSKAIQQEGSGLKNLRSRAAVINAECMIYSTPGEGTSISIFVKL